MELSDPQGGLETSKLPRGFPIWPGVGVGLVVTFGLVGLELLGRTPAPLAGLIGGVMTVAHGMFAFAVVTMLGEGLSIAGWECALFDRCQRAAEPVGDDALLEDPLDPWATQAEIETQTRALTDPWRGIQWIGQIVAYLVPLIGFAVSAWESGGRVPWEVVGRPLLLTLVESFFLILLTLGVSHSLEAVKIGWLSLFSKAVARSPLEGPHEEMMGRPTP